jgi:hypothetical protein
MSQQESHSESEEGLEYHEQQPYNARRTSDMPKHEQLPKYDEDTVPPYSYRAQDTVRPQRPQASEYSRTVPGDGPATSSTRGGQQQQQKQQQQQQMYTNGRTTGNYGNAGRYSQQGRPGGLYNRGRSTWQRYSYSYRGANPALKIILVVLFIFIVLLIILRILFLFLALALALLSGLFFIAIVLARSSSSGSLGICVVKIS